MLVQIDFLIPQNISPQTPTSPAIVNVPNALFQVLVEPDGTTGSAVLLDKATLAQIATVNQAGQVVSFNQGALGFATAAPLSAEVQQLIADVFALKFTDANPKTLNKFTDSVVPDGIPHIMSASPTTPARPSKRRSGC